MQGVGFEVWRVIIYLGLRVWGFRICGVRGPRFWFMGLGLLDYWDLGLWD